LTAFGIALPIRSATLSRVLQSGVTISNVIAKIAQQVVSIVAEFAALGGAVVVKSAGNSIV